MTAMLFLQDVRIKTRCKLAWDITLCGAVSVLVIPFLDVHKPLRCSEFSSHIKMKVCALAVMFLRHSLHTRGSLAGWYYRLI